MGAPGRYEALRGLLKAIPSVAGGLVGFAILFALFGSGTMWFILLLLFMPLGIWMSARGWRRMREDRHDRQERWGLRR